jgi:hypothetical protein
VSRWCNGNDITESRLWCCSTFRFSSTPIAGSPTAFAAHKTVPYILKKGKEGRGKGGGEEEEGVGRVG